MVLWGGGWGLQRWQVTTRFCYQWATPFSFFRNIDFKKKRKFDIWVTQTPCLMMIGNKCLQFNHKLDFYSSLKPNWVWKVSPQIFQSEWIKVLWSKHKYCISLLGCLTGKHSGKDIFTTNLPSNIFQSKFCSASFDAFLQ